MVVILDKLVQYLTQQGYFVANLSYSTNSRSSKWLGVSRLPSHGSRYRRLDIITVPFAEKGAALLYFTGDDVFNRSMRLLAAKKHMCLNQHGLFENVFRGPKRIKVTRGACVASATEESIFEKLQVPFKDPLQRRY